MCPFPALPQQHTARDWWLGPTGGSRLSTLCPQAQGITTAAQNLPQVRRDPRAQGTKVKWPGDAAAMGGAKSPARNHEGSDTSLQAQGPPRSPLYRSARALPGDKRLSTITGRGGSPPGLCWGREGPAPPGHTAPKTIPSTETGAN